MVFSFLFLLFHPFHVSVCEVVYDEETTAIQISQRIFLDDMEDALQLANDDPKFILMKDSAKSHQYLKAYFQGHFKLSLNERSQTYNFLGGEIEDDAIWCYLEITDVKQLESINLTSTLLTEVFDDQKNLVHFKIGGEKKSFILTDTEVRAMYQK